MNHDFLIKTTNKVALYATIALFFWVFIFLTVTIFDLKIFRQYITETFFLSVLGIFSILGGALVLNVMSNLSNISSAINDRRDVALPAAKPINKKIFIALGLSLPLIVGALFIGNSMSANKKKSLLVESAQLLISQNQAELAELANYQFTPEYVDRAAKIISVIKRIDKNFPEVILVLPDNIDKKKVFLSFGGNVYYDDKKKIDKSQFIFSATQDERAYLDKVFSGEDMGYRFNNDKGNYQLYFPASVNGKKIMLYFSDFQRYGKFGS
jgi:hypothetical protein